MGVLQRLPEPGRNGLDISDIEIEEYVMEIVNLPLEGIRIDGGTQPRAETNEATVAEYAEVIRLGGEFPPIVLFDDGAELWLADGFHRYHAHRHAGAMEISCDVRQGTKRDAVLFSVGVNATHGLRRTNADKRKAVETLLKDAEWSKWSDREIARQCGVGAPFVGDVRKAICNRITDRTPERVVTRGGKTYEQDTTNIGKIKLKSEKRTIDARPADVPEQSNADELADAAHTITELSEENDRLSDRVAIAAMSGSDEEKAQAAQTIADLREQVKTLEAENDALKVSRDTYMREANEKQKQIQYWRKQASKVAA